MSSTKTSPSHPVTLISGSRGLAENLIETFSKAGHRLSVLVRRLDRLSELKQRYPDHHFYEGDLVSQSVAASWVKSALAKFGRIDCLINNAAIQGPGGRLHEISFEDFQECVQVNFVIPSFLCHEVLKCFDEQGRGMIFNLSGGGAGYARPNFTAYATAKTAMVRLTETLAKEYPALRFYAISPGGMKTHMTESVLKMDPAKIGQEYEDAKKRYEVGGEDPQKAADLMMWLWENQPSHLNGRMISAVWDQYRTSPEFPESVGWWTLRRVDELCLKNLKSLS